MKNFFAKPFASAFVLNILLVGCSDKPAGGPGPGAAMPPPEVDVMTVAAGSATLTQDLPGRLQAYRTAQVRARVGRGREKIFSGRQRCTGRRILVSDRSAYL